MTTAKVIENKAKQGVEIHFSGRPDNSILEQLKANGWHWSRFNKCWYKKNNNPAVIQFAQKFASTPEAIADDQEQRDLAAYIDAQERAHFERYERDSYYNF